jgi:hypothetical protein
MKCRVNLQVDTNIPEKLLPPSSALNVETAYTASQPRRTTSTSSPQVSYTPNVILLILVYFIHSCTTFLLTLKPVISANCIFVFVFLLYHHILSLSFFITHISVLHHQKGAHMYFYSVAYHVTWMFTCLQIATPVRKVWGKMSSRIVAKDHKVDCFKTGNTGCSIWNATLTTTHEPLYIWNKETNGNIEFLQLYPVVAANALLEIDMARISAVCRSMCICHRQTHPVSWDVVANWCIVALFSISLSGYTLLSASQTAANNFDVK